MLSLFRGPFEEWINKRGEIRVKVLENHDPAGNISGQQRRTMATTTSASGKEGAGDPFLC